MIEHVSLPVKDYQASKAFYTKALAPLGYVPKHEWGTAGGFMEGGHTSFIITQTKEAQPSHVAFAAESKEAIKAFYDAALAAGGRDNGAPGFRPDYGDDYYAAFVYDPDGHNIEACYFGEKNPEAKDA